MEENVQNRVEERMDRLWRKSVEGEKLANLQGLLTIPKNTDANSLAEWFGSEIEKINTYIDRIERITGVECVCQKGCASCCKQAIQVLPTEAKAISAVIQGFSIEEKKKLQQRIDSWMTRIKESGLDTDQNKYYDLGVAEEAIYIFMEQYFKLDLPCPMLSDEGACTIYKVRPGGCWSYRVYAGAEDCKQGASVPGGMKHDNWERYLLDKLYARVQPDHSMKLLPYYIDDILNNRL